VSVFRDISGRALVSEFQRRGLVLAKSYQKVFIGPAVVVGSCIFIRAAAFVNFFALDEGAKIEAPGRIITMIDLGEEPYLLAWQLVAETGPRVWNSVVRAVPELSRRRINEESQAAARTRWYKSVITDFRIIRWLDGVKHSIGQIPAIGYHVISVKDVSVYMNYGRLHNEDGPAVKIEPSELSSLEVEGYYKSGRLYNRDPVFGALRIDTAREIYRFWVSDTGAVTKICDLSYGRGNIILDEYDARAGRRDHYNLADRRIDYASLDAYEYIKEHPERKKREGIAWAMNSNYLAEMMEALAAMVSGMYATADSITTSMHWMSSEWAEMSAEEIVEDE